MCKVWYDKFLMQEVGNGDYISIDLAPFSYGKIIYISHECDEENGLCNGKLIYRTFIQLDKIGLRRP